MKEIIIPVNGADLKGDLYIPSGAETLVLFSHGSGSSRKSPRNKMVAGYLNNLKISTVLFDLLTEEEDRDYQRRFDIELITQRLINATLWIQQSPDMQNYRIGYFGASTGAASALRAAAVLSGIEAVVSRGGRPDLAMGYLYKVNAPTLLIIGGLDTTVIELNKKAFDQLNCIKKLEIVPGATHLFEEKGTMEQVCVLAGNWFMKYLHPVQA